MFVCFSGWRMTGIRRWLGLAVLQCLMLLVSCGKHHHRRSMASQQSIPVSKGGWRPVIGSNGVIFGYNTAPLHAPSYKIPVPVYDTYASSSRPFAARDATKMTSIAQSYRPTTLRSIINNHPAPAASQPINTYFNPFAQNNGLTHYKFFQNFPSDSVVIRNPHNPYAARPVFGKYPPKFKQPYPSQTQHFNNVQPIHFGQYPTVKPVDVFGKPVDTYVKPSGTKSSGTEIFKTEVYKVPDSDSVPQNTQQVKTAQQQATPKVPVSPFPQYAYQDALLQPNILGTYGNFNFGVQQVKGSNQFFPTKTTFVPPHTTKQTLFNSFSFAPNFKSTPIQFPVTTPKLQTTANQVQFGSTWNDFKNVPTQATKQANPAKIDPNLNKGTFKPSPQDPFIKHYNSDYNKVANHLPSVQATTFSYSNFHDYKYQTQPPVPHQNSAVSTAPTQNYFEQPNDNFNSEKKKQKIHDSVAAGLNQQTSQQYVNPPKSTEKGGNRVPSKPTYEVSESYDEIITHASSPLWPTTQESSDFKSTEETGTKQEYDTYSRPTTTPLPEFPEEFAIVTEGFENSLSYDGQVESQSRRPLGDDFEPIGKHKLKDYYYRVSTPVYDDYSSRKTKKPTESSRPHAEARPHLEVTTYLNKQSDLKDALPTLPPNKHFKRPSTPTPVAEPVEKDRIRKRNKIRRRRPPLANINRDKDSTTRKYTTSTEPPHATEESHTYRPRVRPAQPKQPSVTSPTVTTDLTTSAIPTISPTNPTTVKKLANRRPVTTTENYESTVANNKDYDSNRESPIMKIAASSRPNISKITSAAYEYRTSEIPDYSHKQDEKDTPTSDIAVSVSDTLKTTPKSDTPKTFSFHRDAKPIDSVVETVTIREITTDSLKDSSDDATEIATTDHVETTANTGKILKPRLKNKYDRPRFSVKDYRNRLSSTTSTTEKSVESQGPRLRFPQRRIPEKLNDNENTTERKKFTPKDPRHKFNGTENNEQVEKEIHSIRPNRQRQTTTETFEGTTQKISARIRNGTRRPKPTEETTENVKPTTVSRRPLRKKIKDSDAGESSHDVTVTENASENKHDITSERTRSESAIMKIAEKKHQDNIEHLFEHSKRVSDLTLAASKDYNTPGMFKTVATNSRRIPNYFTIATDDPILPIEAFFPQINQKKES